MPVIHTHTHTSLVMKSRLICYTQQGPVSWPQSWNRHDMQPRQPASARLLSDDARSRADRAPDMAASRTTVPRSDSAADDNSRKESDVRHIKTQTR